MRADDEDIPPWMAATGAIVLVLLLLACIAYGLWSEHYTPTGATVIRRDLDGLAARVAALERAAKGDK